MSVELWSSTQDYNKLNSTFTSTSSTTYLSSPWNSTRGLGPGGTVARVAPSVLLVVCFLVGLPSNLAVIIDISRNFRRYAQKQSQTVLCLVLNLAVVDSFTLVSIPLIVYVLVDGWTLGLVSCQVLAYVISCCLYASVLTVTGMSAYYLWASRFRGGDFKLRERLMEHRRKRLLLGLWTLALLFSIPTLFTRQVVLQGGMLRCIRRASSDIYKVTVLLLETVLGFVFPLSILFTCYTCIYMKKDRKREKDTKPLNDQKANNSNRKTMKQACLPVSVLVTFLLCWTPYHIVNMVDILTTLLHFSAPQAYASLKTFRHGAGDAMKTLMFINSTVNPFLYALILWRKLNPKVPVSQPPASAETPGHPPVSPTPPVSLPSANPRTTAGQMREAEGVLLHAICLEP